MNKVTVSVCPLPHFEGLDLPAYETIGSAGMDVRAAVSQEEPILLVLAPVTQLAWIEVDALDETDRGAGGFGSTGR